MRQAILKSDPILPSPVAVLPRSRKNKSKNPISLSPSSSLTNSISYRVLWNQRPVSSFKIRNYFLIMGDSEAVAAEASNPAQYPTTNFASTGYSDPSLNHAPDTSSTMTQSVVATVGDPTAVSYAVNYASAYGGDPNAVMQASQLNVSYEGAQVAAAANANQVAAGLGGTEMEASQMSAYNSTANGSVSGATTSTGVENGIVSGIVSGNVDGSAEEKQAADGLALPMSAEEERLWNIVRANSLDFTAWTSLIEETEKVAESNILKIRKVYDTFLAEFPLCYGYWKKYADHEARLGSIEKVVEVYERAVQGVTYSVDIWLHYCIFAIATYDDPDTIRRLFDRGLAYVGSDYLSYTLWDKYIEYEFMHQEWGRLAVIYTRILENPNQQLDRYFNSFKELAATRPLSELRSAEEGAIATSDVSSTVITNAISDPGNMSSEGDVHPVTEDEAKTVSAGLTEAEELEKYIAVREEMYKKAKEFDSKIIGFETAIRRPYFHVRPLNVVELENWHNYLNFMEREGDFSKVVKLYERCVIACANYPEYWIRYVLCMKASGSMDLAYNALDRATQIFVKRQPEIHLFAARFKERTGDITGARGAYQLVHTEISPGLLDAIIRHANMEHRLGNLEDAYTLYEQAIAIEKGKEHSQTLPMLYAQYARFIYLVSGNAEKAREILVGSLEHVQLSKPLLETIMHLEAIQPFPKKADISFIDSLVEKFINPNAENLNVSSTGEKEELSSIYLEFVNLFGDIQLIEKAEDRHANIFLPHRSMSELKKRHAEDYLGSDKTKISKSYSVQSPAQGLVGSYPNAQNQWGANYGVNAQTWPPVTQAQGQQWPAGYTQQAAYGVYPGYGGSYANPPVSGAVPAVPQTVAYGAYPTAAYPSQQAVPQQNYAQPVAAVAPTQQPAASVPQTYYGTYYNS